MVLVGVFSALCGAVLWCQVVYMVLGGVRCNACIVCFVTTLQALRKLRE